MTTTNETPGALNTERSGQTNPNDNQSIAQQRGYAMYDITTGDFAVIFQQRVVDHVNNYLEAEILINELEEAAAI